MNKTWQDQPGVYATTEDLIGLRRLGKELNLSIKRPSQSLMAGSVRTQYRGRGMEFAEVRPYQPGDDIRTIDWRVTARTQSTYTKLFQEERERPIFVMIDLRSPMFFGSETVFKSVYACQIAATIAWAAMYNNDRIGALVFGDDAQGDIRAKQGKKAVLELLNQLTQFSQTLQSPVPHTNAIQLSDMLKDVRRIAKPGSAVYLISDFHDYDARCTEQLSMISRHCDISAFCLYDQLEKQLPGNNLLTIASNNDKLTISTRAVQKDFAAAFAQHRAGLKQAFTNARVTGIDTPINVKPENLMQHLFSAKPQRALNKEVF